MFEKALKILDVMVMENQVVQERLGYLYSRWQDEKEYEDWEDYDKAIKDLLKPFDVDVKKTMKSPFGCVCLVDNFNVKITLKKANGGLQIAYKFQK